MFIESLKIFPGFDGLRQAGIVELAGKKVAGLTIGISVLKVNLVSGRLSFQTKLSQGLLGTTD